MSQMKSVWFCILVAGLKGIATLSNVELGVSPAVVKKGGHAILTCLRDMQGEPLYSVKWYRGIHEFYRYTPSDTPSVKVFLLPGINVDLPLSNETQVVLRRLDFSMAGNFTCEVTADAPSFSTAFVSKHIDIVALPEYSPVLAPESFEYKPGEMLRANCTGAPSRPAANLTFFINDAVVRPLAFRQFKNEEGLQWNEVEISASLTEAHFPYERLTVRCTAQIYDLYSDGVKMEFPLAFVDPKPEKIMSAYSSTLKISGSYGLLSLFALMIFAISLSFSHVQDFDELSYSIYDEFLFYDEISEKIKSSLIGM